MSKQAANTGTARKRSSKARDLFRLFIFLTAIVLLNLIGTYAFSRLDLTEEKRYSLSDATIEALEELDDIVFFKVYLSGDLSANYARLQRNTKEMLDEFRAHSINIEYEIIDPSEDPDEGVRRAIYQQLADQGLLYTNDYRVESDKRTEKIIFPGAMVSYRTQELPLNLLKGRMSASPEALINSSMQQLEYQLISTIARLTRLKRPNIGFLEGHGELDKLETASIRGSLGEFYNVESVRIDGKLNALDELEALIIAKPDSAFSDKDKFIIDQFVMQGGRVMWFLEPVDVSMDSLMTSENGMTFAMRSDDRLNLDEMPYKYGARVNADLIQDLQAMPIKLVTGQIGNQPKFEVFPWFYNPLIFSKSEHAISKNLDALKTEFVSTIDTLSGKNIRKTVLLSTSQYTKVMKVPCPVSLNIVREPPNEAQFNKPNRPIAVLLEGAFESVFVNRLPPEVTNNPDFGYKEQSPAGNKMIVVSDGDIIRNRVNRATRQYFPLGFDRNTQRSYANAEFIENALFYLLDDSGLIESRTKEFKIRLLDPTRVKNDRATWQAINMVIPIGLILVLGISQAWYRKRKYAKNNAA